MSRFGRRLAIWGVSVAVVGAFAAALSSILTPPLAQSQLMTSAARSVILTLYSLLEQFAPVFGAALLAASLVMTQSAILRAVSLDLVLVTSDDERIAAEEHWSVPRRAAVLGLISLVVGIVVPPILVTIVSSIPSARASQPILNALGVTTQFIQAFVVPLSAALIVAAFITARMTRRDPLIDNERKESRETPGETE